MGEDYTVTAMVHEEEDRIEIDFGYVRIEIEKNAENGPLNPTGEEPRSGVLFWENKYIMGAEDSGGVGLEYGGGPLLTRAETDVDTLIEKLRANKKIADSKGSTTEGENR